MARIRQVIAHGFGMRTAGAEHMRRPPDAWEIPDDLLDGGVWEASQDDGVSSKKRPGRRGSPGPAQTSGTAMEAAASAEGLSQQSGHHRRSQPIDRMALLGLVRGHATPPAATQAATVLMLANAVVRSGHDLAGVLAILRRPKPIVVIVGAARGFEAAFLDLFKPGLILPGKTSLINGYELRSVRDLRMTEGFTPGFRREVTRLHVWFGSQDLVKVGAFSFFAVLVWAELFLKRKLSFPVSRMWQ